MIALLLLAGFAVYAMVISLLLTVPATTLALIIPLPSSMRGPLLLGLLITFLMLGARGARWPPKAPWDHGVRVTAEQAPTLWTHVHELAILVGVRPPDEIWIVPEPTVTVDEVTKLLGLQSGRRRLVLGMPLIMALTVDQLQSVIAHEFGHLSGGFSRRTIYLGRTVFAQVLAHRDSRLTGILLRPYAWFYLMATQALARKLEYQADRAAARHIGSEATRSALREVPIAAAAWDFYLHRYVVPCLDRGFEPPEIFTSFRMLLEARKDALEAMRTGVPSEATARWDPHPPLARRIAAVPSGSRAHSRPDTSPANALIDRLAEVERELTTYMWDSTIFTRLPWPELTTAATTAHLIQTARPWCFAAARLTGKSPADLPLLFSLLEGGRVDDLIAAMTEFGPLRAAPREHAARALVTALAGAIAVAAVRSGRATWQHSWSKPATLVTTAGEPLLLAEPVQQAVDHPGAVAALRSQLAGLGIDLAAGPSVTIDPYRQAIPGQT